MCLDRSYEELKLLFSGFLKKELCIYYVYQFNKEVTAPHRSAVSPQGT